MASSDLPAGLSASAEITHAELALAARNHGMPLEALRHPVTPLGLHYLLIHYDIPAVDPGAWRLRVGGEVARQLELSLAELRVRPSVTRAITFECAGNGRALLEPRAISQPWRLEAVGTGKWTGVPLAPLLEEAGVAAGAAEVLFTGLDRGVEGGVPQRYERSLPLDEALGAEALLAYELNGVPLPPQHGFPLRLVVPGWYGMTNVKWLAEIRVLAEPFGGFQQARAYRLRQEPDEEGEPVTRMAPRALMVPPGVPDFMTRERHLAPGPVRLEGRAWSGGGAIARVEVSTDGGSSWADAEVEPEGQRGAWQGWAFGWEAVAGSHELCCRATDGAGARQPDGPAWNLHGYANNAVQRVPVHVGDA